MPTAEPILSRRRSRLVPHRRRAPRVTTKNRPIKNGKSSSTIPTNARTKRSPPSSSPKQARVTGSGKRATVTIDDLTVGPFTGSIEFSFFAGSRADADRRRRSRPKKTGWPCFTTQGLVADQPIVERNRMGRYRRRQSEAQNARTPSLAKGHRRQPMKSAIAPSSPRGEQRRRRLLPAAAPVSIPPRLLHQSRLRLARQRLSRPDRQNRLRHPPEQRRRRQLRPLVQRPARRDAPPGRVLSAHQRHGRRRTAARRSSSRTTTASSSCPATRPSPATTTWRSPSTPCRSEPKAIDRTRAARLRPRVQGHGRQHGPPRRVPRRRPSQRPRPAPAAGDGGDVRRMPPLVGRHAAADARRRGQRSSASRCRASIPATG